MFKANKLAPLWVRQEMNANEWRKCYNWLMDRHLGSQVMQNEDESALCRFKFLITANCDCWWYDANESCIYAI